MLHRDENRLQEARVAYEEALTLRRQLAQTNPQAYLPDVADSMAVLGLLNKAENTHAEARQLWKGALAIYQEFNAKNPGQFAAKIKLIQSVLADE